DKTALFVEFQNKPSIEDIKHFLQAVKGANTVKLGKFLQMHFNTEKEAEEATVKIKDYGKILVNKAFAQQDRSPKRTLPEAEAKPNKKAKKEPVKEEEEQEEEEE
ncbi:hypothetical protein QHH03_30695, partial [Aphanizomenon sp. 202]|nr:hypothetical protein [Aphanizomenon sp. 202]